MTPERKAELRALWGPHTDDEIAVALVEALDALDAAEAEVARLRALIERAPHAMGCPIGEAMIAIEYGELGIEVVCNCWKTEAKEEATP